MDKHLILLHGALGAAGQFSSIKNNIEGYHAVHTFNFLGHGGEPLPSNLKMVDLSNQLYVFIQEFIPSNSHLTLFGYSMGGYCALLLASKNICRIDRIITLGTKLMWTPEMAEKEVQMLNPEKVEQKVPNFAESLKKLHAPQDWKSVMRLTQEMMVDLGNQQYLRSEVLANIHVSVKLMIGDKDQMVSLEETVQGFKSIPGASLAVLPNTQHPLDKLDVSRLLFELA